jgi:hypothetical protein
MTKPALDARSHRPLSREIISSRWRKPIYCALAVHVQEGRGVLSKGLAERPGREVRQPALRNRGVGSWANYCATKKIILEPPPPTKWVSAVSDPDPETLQKANLAAGEMYDLLQKRDLAMKKYQIVLAENASTPPAEQARQYIKEAYRE